MHTHPRARPIRTGLGIADLSFRFRSWLDAFANSNGARARASVRRRASARLCAGVRARVSMCVRASVRLCVRLCMR